MNVVSDLRLVWGAASSGLTMTASVSTRTSSRLPLIGQMSDASDSDWLLQVVADHLVTSSGIRPLLHSFAVDVIMEDDTIKVNIFPPEVHLEIPA